MQLLNSIRGELWRLAYTPPREDVLRTSIENLGTRWKYMAFTMCICIRPKQLPLTHDPGNNLWPWFYLDGREELPEVLAFKMYILTCKEARHDVPAAENFRVSRPPSFDSWARAIWKRVSQYTFNSNRGFITNVWTSFHWSITRVGSSIWMGSLALRILFIFKRK